jgi:hypothetical protein
MAAFACLLSDLELGARQTLHLLDPRPPVSAPAPPRRGRPRRHDARAVALQVLFAFEEITGGKATIRVAEATAWPYGKFAHGPFVELLGDVFCALGLDASPEHHARQAITEKNSLAEVD